jgi:adenylosuccinate lyase
MPGADGCRHERGHVLDSLFHGDGYATAASRRIFCDHCRLQRWLDVEAALALSQAELDMIPGDAAAAVARACAGGQVDLDSLGDEFRRTGHSLVPLLRAVQAVSEGETGEFVHFGATTQDIQDTAQALEMRDVLDLADRDVAEIVGHLTTLAETHRGTLMVGRTHAQPALPITFGLKVAGWLDELLRQAGRLEAMRTRVLVAELFGGAGTMAGFGERGPELLDRFAARLGLGVPIVAWHASRDRIAEYAVILAMLAATLARIADEVRTLSRAEVQELAEGWEHGQVGSSTMPHKRNPENSEQVVVLARLARANAQLALECMIQEHERDARGLRIEWVAVADVSHHTLAALALTVGVVGGLQVFDERMSAYAHQEADAICSEALMLELGRRMGKQTAHTFVYELSQQAQSQGRSLRAVLSELPAGGCPLDGDDLDRLFDPARYLGSSEEIVDRVVADARHWLAGLGPRERVSAAAASAEARLGAPTGNGRG